MNRLGGFAASKALSSKAAANYMKKLPPGIVKWAKTTEGAKVVGRILKSVISENLGEGMEYQIDRLLSHKVITEDGNALTFKTGSAESGLPGDKALPSDNNIAKVPENVNLLESRMVSKTRDRQGAGKRKTKAEKEAKTWKSANYCRPSSRPAS